MLHSLLLASLFACAARHASSPDLVYQLDREVIALKQRIASMEAEDCSKDTSPSPIYPQLVQVLPEGVALSRRGKETMITLQVSDLFAGSSLRIRSENRMVLDLLATALNLHPDHEVVVEGHGHDHQRGSRSCYPTPWEMAGMRAAALARELVGTYAVAPERITVASRGDTRPVVEGDTPEGQAANKRLVIRIFPATATNPEPSP